MLPTTDRSARPYSEAALPDLVLRAGVHLQVPNNLRAPNLPNTADLALVSFIRPLGPALC